MASKQWLPWPLYKKTPFRDVKKRIKNGTPLAERLEIARCRLKNRSLRSLAVVTMALLVFATFLQWIFDYHRYRIAVNSLQLADIKADEANKHIVLLSEYINAPAYRHLGLSVYPGKIEGKTLLASWAERSDEAFTHILNAEAEPGEKATLARIYLENAPNGRHRELAAKTVIEAENEIKRLESERERIRVEGADKEFSAAVTAEYDMMRRIEISQAYLNAHPNGKHRELALQTIREGELEIKRNEITKRYDDYMRDGQLDEAAKLILDNSGISGELRKNFQLQAPQHMQRQINQECTDANFDYARALLGNYERAPAEVFDSRELFARLRIDVDKAEDRYLYDEVRKYRDSSSCDRYLEKTNPRLVRNMTMHVDKYAYFLEEKTGKLPIDIYIRKIDWVAPWMHDSGINLQMSVNGILALDVKGISTKKDIYPHFRGRIIEKLTEPVSVEIKLTDIGWAWDNAFGKAAIRVTPLELSQGKTISMDEPKHVMMLQAVYDLQEPILPLYQEH